MLVRISTWAFFITLGLSWDLPKLRPRYGLLPLRFPQAEYSGSRMIGNLPTPRPPFNAPRDNPSHNSCSNSLNEYPESLFSPRAPCAASCLPSCCVVPKFGSADPNIPYAAGAPLAGYRASNRGTNSRLLLRIIGKMTG
ncbi:hypothetical protein QBC34DRAFT_22534 [Podospora aff. communis PSN243]|uniref:Secreted protein n=1 Tax=Podospora aff. communis PSN243 TaxID=3040156 RepID=A0AAV9GZ83_9PEZI|nr:hypothetical protein QBC34DRAFT_22534 [Podospora aff. communis PSN243]